MVPEIPKVTNYCSKATLERLTFPSYTSTNMAAPPSKSLKNLTGKWKLNKSLSDDISPVLELQGVNLLLRKAISSASVHLRISQPSENEIRVEQTATAAGIPGTTEQYTLDYQWRENKDAFFGQVKGRSRWIEKSEVTEDGLKGELDKLDEEEEEGELIEATSEHVDGKWAATHVWGFLEIQGQRRHVRKVVVRGKNGEEVRVMMVYDWDE